MILDIEPHTLSKIAEVIRDEIPAADHIDIERDVRGRAQNGFKEGFFVRAWLEGSGDVLVAFFHTNGELHSKLWT